MCCLKKVLRPGSVDSGFWVSGSVSVYSQETFRPGSECSGLSVYRLVFIVRRLFDLGRSVRVYRL